MGANLVLKVEFLAQRCSAAGMGASSGAAVAQKTPDGHEWAPYELCGCELHSQGQGSVAAHLLARRRQRGPGQGPLKHISLLSSSFLGRFPQRHAGPGQGCPRAQARLCSRTQTPARSRAHSSRHRLQAELGLAGDTAPRTTHLHCLPLIPALLSMGSTV